MLRSTALSFTHNLLEFLRFVISFRKMCAYSQEAETLMTSSWLFSDFLKLPRDAQKTLFNAFLFLIGPTPSEKNNL